jgi:hypothetical protein
VGRGPDVGPFRRGGAGSELVPNLT